MRLVCPNCVAQYEVADGTIPDSGRDVQCANCNHIWFQDAAFKLSTDDLTHAPQKLHSTYHDDDEDADDSPGVFHSMRAPRMSGDPGDVTGRTLPEVGNNVLDILRSEAAFSSRRRAEAKAGQPEPDHTTPDGEDGAEDSAEFSHRRTGSRASDMPPPQEPEDTEPEDTEPETAHRATDDLAEDPGPETPETSFRKPAWRHMGDDRQDEASAGEANDAEAGETGDGDLSLQDDGAATTLLREDPEADQMVTALAADEVRRIAEAAVARREPAPETAEPTEAEPEEDFRQAIRRVSVRSLAGPSVEPESTGIPLSALMRQTPDEPTEPEDPYREEPEERYQDDIAAAEEPETDRAADIPPEDDIEDDAEEGTEEEAVFGADTEAPEETRAAPDTEPDLAEDDGETETDEQPDETAPSPAPIDDPDDIRQLRRSLVENRKVLLPDVDELNTSLRMENSSRDVDLRSSAFSEEDAANRSRFWLGLVTALMLFGIVSALYLMGPAISDAFPAADPYVAAFRDLADSALDATARAWVPVVDWLESL